MDWVIRVPAAGSRVVDSNGFQIRRAAADLGVSLTTDPWVARRLVRALATCDVNDMTVEPWSYYVPASSAEQAAARGAHVGSRIESEAA